MHHVTLPTSGRRGSRTAGWQQALEAAGVEAPSPLPVGWNPLDGLQAGRLLAAVPSVTAVSSWTRDALIRTGDIYSPARGHLVMAVPALAGFLLTHYDGARDHTDIELLPLVQLQRNASLGTQVGTGSGRPPSPRPGHERRR